MRDAGDDGLPVEVPAGLCRSEGQRLLARDPVLGILIVSRRKSLLVTRWSPLGCEEDPALSGGLRQTTVAISSLQDSDTQCGAVPLEKAVRIYATDDDQEDVIVVESYDAVSSPDGATDTTRSPASPNPQLLDNPTAEESDTRVCSARMFWLPTLSGAEVVERIHHLFDEETPKAAVGPAAASLAKEPPQAPAGPAAGPPAVEPWVTTKKARHEETLSHFKVPPHVSLSTLLDPSSTLPLLRDTQVCEELLTHLPATQRTVADLAETLRSPQFSAVVRSLDSVIHSGHGDVLLRSMGVCEIQPPLLVCTLLNVERAIAPFVASLVKHFAPPEADPEQPPN